MPHIIGCRSPQPSLAGTPFDLNPPPQYVLQFSDRLLIPHTSDPELDQEVLIRTDGMISFPHINDVQVPVR
jgi:hypothetical protein